MDALYEVFRKDAVLDPFGVTIGESIYLARNNAPIIDFLPE